MAVAPDPGCDQGLAALADRHLGALAVAFQSHERTRELGETLAQGRLRYEPQAAPDPQVRWVTARLRLPPPVYRTLDGLDVGACTRHVTALLREEGYALQTFIAVPDATTEAIGAVGLPHDADDLAGRIRPDTWTSAVDVDVATERYLEGWTQADIAAEFGVTASRISGLLPDDVKRRAKERRRNRRVDVDAAARLYLQGWTQAEIATEFGVGQAQISKLLPDDVKRQAKQRRRPASDRPA